MGPRGGLLTPGQSSHLILRPGLTCTFGGLQPARSSTLHVPYINICSAVASYHLSYIAWWFFPPRSDLREVLAMPSFPPAGAPAAAVTLKNASEKCTSQMLPFVSRGCTSRQADTGRASWQLTEATTNRLSWRTEDVIDAGGPHWALLLYPDSPCMYRCPHHPHLLLLV